jgi:predicted short-subunit dehydrogenase-like oxidoreductase (DUF2520 family)
VSVNFPITIIGSGNVAYHLGKRLLQNGFSIYEIFARNSAHASELADVIGCKLITDIKKINQHEGAFIICVNDDAIAEIGSHIPFKPKLLIHTSGSKEMQILRNFAEDIGVIYPVQSLHKKRKINWDRLPLAIEGSSAEATQMIHALASAMSSVVFELPSEKRIHLHLAAVLVNNFTNWLYKKANDECAKHEIPFEYLLPLIQETANRLNDGDPEQWQTGPAKRNDQEVLSKHLSILNDDVEMKKIYEYFSASIQHHFSTNDIKK